MKKVCVKTLMILILMACVFCGKMYYEQQAYLEKEVSDNEETIKKDKMKKVYINASWSYNYGDVQELAENSDIVARVIVKSNGVANDSGLQVPETNYDVEVVENILGGKEGDVITLQMTGGIKQDCIYEVIDDPLMKKGEEYIIFARKTKSGEYITLSGSQGRMEYKDNRINSLNIVRKQVKENNLYSNIECKDMSMKELKRKIKGDR